MSMEEYFNSDMYKAKDNLCEIISQDRIDWDRFDFALHAIPDIISVCDGHTILSELYHDCPNGSVLVEITKRFLSAGYDIVAHNGLNGSQCLHNLCWATFDKEILAAAKFLLAAGARTDLPLDMDEENIKNDGGVKGSISWRLSGDRIEGYYTVANIFEAYRAIIEAFEAGKDYQSICGFEDCIGEYLTRVELIPADENISPVEYGPLSLYRGRIVFWFGSKPLVLTSYVSFLINPLVVEEHRNKAFCVDEFFSPLLNARLNQFVFIDQRTTQLLFDNGMYLLVSCSDHWDYDQRVGFFEIRTASEATTILDKKVLGVALLSGTVYSDRCDKFEENSVVLICKSEAFLLHAYPEGYSKDHEIRLVECSQEFASEYTRKVVLPELIPESTFSHNGKLVGMRLRCGTEFFYIFVTENNKLILKLDAKRITSHEDLQHDQRSEILEFRT